MTEHRFQQFCATYLSHVLPQDAYWTAVDAGQGAMNLRAGQARKARGVKAGFVDLLIVRGGRFYGIELKTEKGRLSEAQHHTHAQLEQAGAALAVCRSIADVERALLEWGFPLRGTTLSPAERDASLAVPPKPSKQRVAKVGRVSVKRGNEWSLALARGTRGARD